MLRHIVARGQRRRRPLAMRLVCCRPSEGRHIPDFFSDRRLVPCAGTRAIRMNGSLHAEYYDRAFWNYDLLAFQRPSYLNSGAALSWSAVAFIAACHFLSESL